MAINKRWFNNFTAVMVVFLWFFLIIFHAIFIE